MEDYKTESKFFPCDCDCGGINATYWVDIDKDGKQSDPEYHFSYFRYGHNKEYNFFDKLRLIWYIIRYGHPYTDEVCLNVHSVNNLIAFLMKPKMKKKD